MKTLKGRKGRKKRMRHSDYRFPHRSVKETREAASRESTASSTSRHLRPPLPVAQPSVSPQNADDAVDVGRAWQAPRGALPCSPHHVYLLWCNSYYHRSYHNSTTPLSTTSEAIGQAVGQNKPRKTLHRREYAVYVHY
jgi:hypothetical protein